MALAAGCLGFRDRLRLRTGAAVVGDQRFRARYALCGRIGQYSSFLAGPDLLFVRSDPGAIPGDLRLEPGVRSGDFIAQDSPRWTGAGHRDAGQTDVRIGSCFRVWPAVFPAPEATVL